MDKHPGSDGQTTTEGFSPRSIKDERWCWMGKSVLYDHAKDIGALGVAVYACLTSFVDAKQTCYPTQERIGEILGYSRVSINKAIRLLQSHGLIVVDKRGRHNCVYRLPKVRCKAIEPQPLSPGTLGVKQKNTNENHPTRPNDDTTRQNGPIHSAVADESKMSQPISQNETLAMELADVLSDHKHLSYYLHLTRKYPESLLRAALRDVLAVPERKIRKSRAALFVHLIQAYAKQQTNNPNH